MKKKVYISKFPQGGYLDFQEDFKGFSVGPHLTQDNSYYRSIMPKNREDINAEINQSNVFSDINNTIGGINQGVSQVGGLLSQFSQNPQTQLPTLPNLSGWGVGQKSDEQLNFENDQAMKKAGVFNEFYPQQEWRGVPFKKYGGRVGKYADGGIPIGMPEYIHPSNVFNPHVIPVPKVHFSDDTTGFDMGTNLNDLVQKNGGKLFQYKGGGTVREQYESITGLPWVTAKEKGLTNGSYESNMALLQDLHRYKREVDSYDNKLNDFSAGVKNRVVYARNHKQSQNDMFGGREIPSFPYGGYIPRQRTFNSNTNRMGAEELMSANANDFMHTKVKHDRQKYEDNKVDWGFMDWAKEPVGAVTGFASTIPVVGGMVDDVVGDSFLTRTGGYQLGKGAGRVAQGAGQVVGGAVTGNPAMIAGGVGEIGGGVGSTIGSLNAESAMSGYDKSGYIEGKQTEKGANDFSGMMNSIGGLYGNVAGGLDSLKNFGGFDGMMNNLKGGQTGMKGFGNAMMNIYGNGVQFKADGGKVDVPKWASNVQVDDTIEGGYNFNASYPAYWYSTKKLDSSGRQKHFNMIVNDMIESGDKQTNIPREVRNIAGYGLDQRDLYNLRPNIGFDAKEVDSMYQKYDKNNFKNGGKVSKTQKQSTNGWLDKY